MNNLKDFSYLRMAYALAAKAKGWASPNPYVGTVIVRKDVIVGYGYHEGPGKPHAEIIALQRAGSLAKKSTAYITLEPCVHWGRTPPCVESIIQAGLKKIVISDLDANPLVYKGGIKKIREAGINVSTGLLKEKNRILNEAYLKYITKKIPFATAKAAVSLDGKIATKKFSSQWISSAPTREYVHLLRGEYDAVMIGINTLLKDDPRLTVRHPNWKGKQITRIILDAYLRFPMKARILSTLNKGRIIVFTLKKPSQRKADALRKKGVKVIPLRSASSFIDLKEVLVWLGKQEISSLLVEGGGRLLTSMFEEKLVDKVFLSVTPRLIGGKRAPSLFQGDGVDLIKDSLRLKRINYFQINEDCLLEGYL
jgi:diaminohydroxyphosphoribosylaminopyrimidine deaminase/5-amino-6-(5-phosphoribosylamino)uracil reductase